MSRWLVCLLIGCCLVPMPLAAGDAIDALVRMLDDDAFEVREQATKDLAASAVTIARLRELHEAATSPEVCERLRAVIRMKSIASGWVKLVPGKLDPAAAAHGREADGSSLYLVRARVDGSEVIGKHQVAWNGGNFPVGKVEQMIEDCDLWVGRGKWVPWREGLKDLLVMGVDAKGRMIHAARAPTQGGLHLGTLVEGQAQARISWGGSVASFHRFEVLVKAE